MDQRCIKWRTELDLTPSFDYADDSLLTCFEYMNRYHRVYTDVDWMRTVRWYMKHHQYTKHSNIQFVDAIFKDPMWQVSTRLINSIFDSRIAYYF